MRWLAIECASEACSVALFEDDALIAHDHRMLGRGHAEHLVPMIAALPDRGRAQRIAVSRGPGSFTGVRIGLATARALALAWRAELVGYPTLALVAAGARVACGPVPVTAAMNGGHGEIFLQGFAPDGLPTVDLQSLAPDVAAAAVRAVLLAGTRATELAALVPGTEALALHPDARLVDMLPPALLTSDTTALYGRAPDARLPSAHIPAP